MDRYSGKKKKSGGGVWIAAVAIIVILAGVVFAASQNWKTGENSIVEMIKAQQGDPEALYQQALKAQAKKVIGDPNTAAIPLFEKAAAGGHVKAMMALADIYNKSSTEADGDKANEWLQKASDAGNIEAKRKLAQNIGTGRGKGEPDITRADKLMGEAAAAGDGPAQLIYGRNLAGQGKYADAEGWLLKAAAQNVPGSAAALGALYYANESTLKDYAKAFEWYSKAAPEGDTQSQLNLSYMYFAGRATKKDLAEAWKWLVIADNTQLNVRRAKGFLEENSRPEDRAEGDRRAAEWFKAHPKAE